MKKSIKMFGMTACAVLATCSFAACAPTPHEHTYPDAWTQDTAATLFTDGLEKQLCTDTKCDAEDKGVKTRAIPALGKTADGLKAAFNFNADAVAKSGTAGIALNHVTTNDNEYTGAGTYFNEADKILEFDGNNKTTIGFDVDFSSFDENDYSAFTLSFSQGTDLETSAWAAEAPFMVKKTAEGYQMAYLTPYFADNDDAEARDAENLTRFANAELKSEIIEDADNKLSFAYEYEYNAEGILTVKLLVNDAEAFTFVHDIMFHPDGNFANEEFTTGARSLWNTTSSKDGAVLSNLTKTVTEAESNTDAE